MRSGQAIRFHPGTELFVPLASEALAALAADIKANGLKDRIAYRWIKDEADNDTVEVIHGRFRLAALEMNGAELFRDGKPNSAYFREFDLNTDGNPIQFIVSQNIRHRPLYEAMLSKPKRAARPARPRSAAKRASAKRALPETIEPEPPGAPTLPALEDAVEKFPQLDTSADLDAVLKGLVMLYEGVGRSSEQAVQAAVAGLADIDNLAKRDRPSYRRLLRRL